ncbi:MAG: hypothetical protein ACXVCY_19135 [Pseudobdellovibrionaceae bacterium]
MNIFILILVVINNNTALAADCCPVQLMDSSLNNLASSMAVITNKASAEEGANQTAMVETALLYGKANFDNENINEDEAQNLIDRLTPLLAKKDLNNKFKSKIHEALGVIHGIVARTKGSSGSQEGIKAFEDLKVALSLDPNNISVVEVHARAILGIYEKSLFVRTLAEKALKLDLIEQITIAKNNFERLNLTSNQYYFQILKNLEN